MPTLSDKQCDDIIRYLQTEAFKDAVIKGPLIDDVVDLLNDNGYTIPTSNRGKVLLGTSGNTQRYALLKSDKVNLAVANQDSVDLGFNDLLERDDYTRNIQVKGKATTGTQKTSKVTPANVTPPSRALNATFFDHNGMMAKNILSIAATGLPEAGWIASAKNVAAGTNYTTEFPISVGASYIQGDRGINQALQGTAGSAPANIPTPTPPATPPPGPTPAEETEETPEVVEEVVEEEAVAIAPGALPMSDKISAKAVKGYGDAQNEQRRLSISKWEERDKSQSGMYPYPLKDQPIYFVLTPAAEDTQLQLSNQFANPDDWDADPNAPANSTPLGLLVIQQSKKIHFTTEATVAAGSSPVSSIALTTSLVDTFTLKWASPGDPTKIELLECKNKNGEVMLRVIDGEIVQLESPHVIFGNVAQDLLANNQTVSITGKIMQIIVGAESSSASALGYPNGEWTEQLLEWIKEHTVNQGARILFYNTQTQPIATVDVYEEDLPDVDGSVLVADDVLARIAGQVSDTVDVGTTYLKVYLNMDYAGARTTDLFSGRITDSDSRLTCLILPGDQLDLDIAGVNDKLGLADQFDRVTALKEIKTSTPVPAKDSDGNDLGYAGVSDATITFEHNGKTEVVQIPDLNGELVAWDSNGEEVRGQVDSIEVHTGNAAAQYETQKMIRRSNRMSPSYNLPNPSATDQNATASVAFRIGRKYYIIGRRAGQPVLVEIDLNYQKEA